MQFNRPGMVARTNKHRRNPKDNREATNPQPVTPIMINEAEAAGSVLTLTFDRAVNVVGTPAITTDVAGAEPVSVAQSAPNVVEITYSASIAAATALTIPFRDPAIRNSSGGFVTSNTFPLAA